MKTLYILRHGKAKKGEPGTPDSERRLTPEGEAQASAMGRRLRELQIHPDAVITSPAQRAVQTTDLVVRALGMENPSFARDDRIYNATSDELMAVVRSQTASADTLLMVGHNPGFEDLANLLAGGAVGHMPTCGLCGIQLDCDSWERIKPDSGKVILRE